jgi:hypothetical protein
MENLGPQDKMGPRKGIKFYMRMYKNIDEILK